jgi:hypothetical protein
MASEQILTETDELKAVAFQAPKSMREFIERARGYESISTYMRRIVQEKMDAEMEAAKSTEPVAAA